MTSFEHHLGIVLDDFDEDGCVGHLDVVEHLTQPYGIVHGGVFCSLVETLGSVAGATWAMGQGMRGAVGIHNATDFVRSLRSGRILGAATPVHRGRTQQLWSVDVTRASDGALLATGRLRMQNVLDEAAIGGIDRPEPPGT